MLFRSYHNSAKIHGLNKRTLHYYDTIGLFSPHYKGDNNYRYYDDSQSIQLEYIRMLKELNMSIKEIKEYLNHPNQADFLRIADTKLKEIGCEIRRLKKSRQILLMKKKQLELCSQIHKRSHSAAANVIKDYTPIMIRNRINFMSYSSSFSACIMICVMYSSALEITKSLSPVSYAYPVSVKWCFSANAMISS